MAVSLVDIFQSGGSFMWVILFAFALGVAIIIERFIFLFYKYNINAPKLYQQIRQTVLNGNIKNAINYCDDSPLPAVLKAGLQRFLIKRDEVEAAMEEAMLEVTPKLQKRTHYLSVIANIATLLGLLGTIIGLIYAFSAISEAEPGEKAIQLARGFPWP